MIKYLAVFSLLTGCANSSPSASPEHQTVFETIEANVRLPAGAFPLDRYSRNYAKRPDGKFVATYIVPFTSLQHDEGDLGCDVMLEDFGSRPCSEAEIAESHHRDLQYAKSYGTAGETRWFDNYLEMPFINDGGCLQIDIVFDPLTSVIESVKCNGAI